MIEINLLPESMRKEKKECIVCELSGEKSTEFLKNLVALLVNGLLFDERTLCPVI